MVQKKQSSQSCNYPERSFVHLLQDLFSLNAENFPWIQGFICQNEGLNFSETDSCYLLSRTLKNFLLHQVFSLKPSSDQVFATLSVRFGILWGTVTVSQAVAVHIRAVDSAAYNSVILVGHIWIQSVRIVLFQQPIRASEARECQTATQVAKV